MPLYHRSTGRRHENFPDAGIETVHEVRTQDDGVGRIIRELQKRGIEKDTLLVFTSDNGPWKAAKEINFMGMGGDESTGSALPLSGWKGETLEGGMRVPTVMRWPGHFPANTRCDELASTLDLFPTIASLVGEAIPGDRVIDGKDISNLLKNPQSRSSQEYFYYYSIRSGNLNAIRNAQGYKLHLWRAPEG